MHVRRRWRLGWSQVAVLLASAWLSSGPASLSAAEPAIHFNRDVQPILSANCFFCHGPDDKHREADMRFDTEASIAMAFGGGQLDKSKAWGRIISDDPDKKMPPPDSHKQLKPAEIDVLRRWIEQGAPWEGHWSFSKPSKPALPQIANRAWASNPIDHFVLARLQREALNRCSI